MENQIKAIEKKLEVKIIKGEGTKVGAKPSRKLTAKEVEEFTAFVNANRTEILVYLAEKETEAEAKKQAEIAKKERSISFIVGNWELHEVTIDPEGDLDEQFKNCERVYKNDMTAEDVKNAYEKAVAKKEVKVETEDETEVEVVSSEQTINKEEGDSATTEKYIIKVDGNTYEVWDTYDIGVIFKTKTPPDVMVKIKKHLNIY